MTSNKIKKEIEDKILKEAKKECLEDNRIRKAISLTLAECQKEIKELQDRLDVDDNMDYWKEKFDNFIQKLKEEIMIACDNKADALLLLNRIDKLAKEFGIKQVGEEFKEDYDEAIKKGKPIIK